MTSSAEEVANLTRWAAGLGRDDQDRLLLALANLLSSARLGARSRELFDSLLPALGAYADAAARRELALRLSDAPWAPPALLHRLALEADEEMGLLLARSPALPPEAAMVLLAQDRPELRLALACNARARLGPETLDSLVAASRRWAALRAPLARRPDLSPEQAARLASWSTPPLRRALTERFGLEEAAPAPPIEPEAARRLVEKLGRAGRLTPAYALSALRRGRLAVFQEAMAALGGVPAEVLRKASQAEDPASLALACAAGGVDRAVFPEVLRDVRAANNGRPAGGPGAAPAVIAAFARPPAEAADALRVGHARRSARWAVG